MKEKATACATYLPGLIGFAIGCIYILAKGPGCNGRFFRFHFYQACLLSVLSFLVVALSEGSTGVLIGTLRLLEGVLGAGVVSFIGSNLNLVTMILLIPFALVVPYSMIMALIGRITNIPWVSTIIMNNMQ
ncbi:MAG: hypothetical protein K2X93_01255 [Candidatus Obscuribacterales bacterium]|nr:hypothetical protein [Candidatus Obscuribacterales bacterium]